MTLSHDVRIDVTYDSFRSFLLRNHGPFTPCTAILVAVNAIVPIYQRARMAHPKKLVRVCMV